MNATRWMACLAVIAGLGLFCMNASPLAAQETKESGGCAGGQGNKVPEYNAEQAAAAEKNPVAQLKALDDFVAKYPNSCLLNYVYPLYYKNYFSQKNYAKAIEYCDKQIALGDKLVGPAEKYDAYNVRAYAYIALPNPDPATAKAARDAALAGVQAVNQFPKPADLEEAKFKEQKEKSIVVFYGTAGKAAMDAKDCAGAVESYKAVLAITPDDLASIYALGRAYSCTNPPQTIEALWYFARAATSKNANEQQSKSIKGYIRKLIANYQGNTVCDALTDAEMNELLQLAGSSADRPASYKLFSADDLKASRDNMTIATVVTDLKAGGDKAKLTWTAACGLEFPDVPGKLLEVTPGADVVQLREAFFTSDAEFDAANTPNMEVKIVGQPEAARVEKGNPARFTATLDSYDPDPAFMLHWSKGKVNAEDLPKEKAAPKKPAPRRSAPKKP